MSDSGNHIPRRSSPLLRGLGRAALGVIGWHVEGELPNIPRCVIIVAPHTANWDFVVGIATMFALDLRLSYFGKHTLFRRPFGRMLRDTGGIPVDRRAPAGVVERAIELLRGSPQMFLGLSPEGTRRKVERWKSGYYRIARGAGVPICPVALDYSRRAVRIMDLFTPSGDHDADEAKLRALYSPAMARYPGRY
jgi:1-acyl-sn-glycerol-3-phosphate acyltransferase